MAAKQRKRRPTAARRSAKPVDRAYTGSRDDGPRPSARYTPARPSFRVRPKWHRVAGWAGVAFGIAIAVANDAMLFDDDLLLLPFGHSELYLLLGITASGASTWFLGLFDSGTTVYD